MMIVRPVSRFNRRMDPIGKGSVCSRQRGSLLIDALLGVVIVASLVSTLNYIWRIADHYTAVWGTVSGFARMHEAERSYRRAGFTGPIDFQSMQFLMPGVKVYSPTSAHRNGVGHPYELQMIGGEQVLTTMVENEAQASQIVQKMPGKAVYIVEADGFRISYRPVRVDPLEQLIQRHSMHVSGPHGTHLYDRLNFGPGAIVTVGDPCLPPDGVHSGGIAIDASGRPVTCVRIFPGTSVLDREWRLVAAGSSSPVNPPLTEACGDGTTVTSRNADCKDCPNGSNILRTATCPSLLVPHCGDGTAVVDPVAECMDCWDGSNIHVADICPPQPTEQCDDGTFVFERALECQDCSDGTNIPILDTCPVDTPMYCGDGSPVVHPNTECKDCPDGSNIHVVLTCPEPPSVPSCGDGTTVADRSMECKDCWDGSNIAIAADCPDRPLVERCGDGTVVNDVLTDCKDCPDGSNVPIAVACPVLLTCWDGSTITPPALCPPQPSCGDGTSVTNPAADCKDCSNGTNIPTSSSCPVSCACGGWAATVSGCPAVTYKGCPAGCPSVCPLDSCPIPAREGPTSCSAGFTLVEQTANCKITGSCVADACPCGAIRLGDGTCPAVDKQELGAISCPSGYSRVRVAETACTITHECQQTCACEGGTFTYPATCPPVVKDELGPSSCPSGYARTPIDNDQCAITYACQQTCPCEGGTVTHPASCPAIVKDELGPATCPTGYTRTPIDNDQCSITYACQKACPCESGVVTHPATCPAVVKDVIGPTTCPSGYTRTKIGEDQCTISYACQKPCPCNGGIATHPLDCPPIVRDELGARSCSIGCDLVVTSQSQCSITRGCQQTCWNDAVMMCGADCPAKPTSCANGNTYPDCCCPNMVPIVTEYEDSIVWSCPPKPTTGVPVGVNPGPHWTIVTIEHECYIERTLVCTGSIGACFGPGDYCSNPTQVWYGPNLICDQPSAGCDSNTGYVCEGDGAIGPGL